MPLGIYSLAVALRAVVGTSTTSRETLLSLAALRLHAMYLRQRLVSQAALARKIAAANSSTSSSSSRKPGCTSR